MSTKMVHQITSGIAGWLTYEQMRNGVDNLTEGSLYKPIEEIAKGRGFEVKHEFPIPKDSPGRGGPKEIDFVIVDRKNRTTLALEVKYKKLKKMAGSISDDAYKLSKLTLEQVNSTIKERGSGEIRRLVSEFKFTRAVIIVWRKDDIVSHVKMNESKAIRKQFLNLISGLLPAGVAKTARNIARRFILGAGARPVGDKIGSLRAGSTITNERFWVAAFIETPAWKRIGIE